MNRSRIIFFWGAVSVLGVFGILIASSDAAGLRGCEAQGSRRVPCFESLIEDRARQSGIEAGFELLAAATEANAEFAASCHGATHLLGDVAYEAFKTHQHITLSTKTSYCGFGFYHGLMEALLSDTGDLAEAERFCAYVDEELRNDLKSISFACYHGIGHGVASDADVSTWGDASRFIAGGLSLCKRFDTRDMHRERCASGVFNALAIAYLDPKYHLDPDPEDPFAICRSQSPFDVQRACYDQMNSYVSMTHASFSEALHLAAAVDPPFAPTAVGSLALFRATNSLLKNNALAEISTCEELTPALATSCIDGFAGGMVEAGKPEDEYERAVDVCIQLKEDRRECLTHVIYATRDRFDALTRTRACEYIRAHAGDSEGDSCMTLMVL